MACIQRQFRSYLFGLVKNQHVGARAKHIDVRAHFIRELEDQGYLMVHFVRSEENSVDIATSKQELSREVAHKARSKDKKWES